MADSFIGIDEPGTIDKKADTEQLTVGANTVERERVEVSGAGALEIAAVKNAAPGSTLYGLVVRLLAEAVANALFAKITDGTNTLALRTAAPASGDVALVARVLGVYDTAGVSAMDNTLNAVRTSIVGDSVGVTKDTDDGSVAAAQSSIALSLGLPYSFDGSAWTRAGASIFRSLDLDETEEEVKATAGVVYGYYFANLATSVRFLKFYNATAAVVVVGTTTPVLTIPIPASSAANVSFGPTGIAFGTAITVAATTGVADSDVGAPAANDVVLNLFYK